MTSTGRIVSRGAVALVLMAVAVMPSASAAGGPAGTLDKSFGHAGRLAIAFGSADSFGQAVAHQGAKIVVAGTHELSTTADVEVARLNPGGGPDRTFGGDGKVTVDLAGGYDQADAVAVLPDGKIMVAGTRSVGMAERFMALRLTRNGHLDHTFGGGDGFVTTGFGNTHSSAYDLAVLSDGRFVLCGATTGSAQPVVALARYHPDGGLDPSFGNHGLVKTTFPGQTQSFCLGVAHDRNKTVIVGSVTDVITTSIAIARFGPGGAPDMSFNQDGYALIPSSAQTSTDDVLALPPAAWLRPATRTAPPRTTTRSSCS